VTRNDYDDDDDNDDDDNDNNNNNNNNILETLKFFRKVLNSR
jgi:hypothetical protein